jgi:hypothetical protein
VAGANRPPKEQPTKEPAEGSRKTVDEALARAARVDKKRGRPPANPKPQADADPNRAALDD